MATAPPAPERRAASGLQAYTRQFKAGEFVFREGDLGTEMFIVQEGKIEIQKAVGKRDKVLAVLEKGDFFGEVSILEDLPRTASARAQSDVTLVEINGSTFDHMLRSNPEIAVRMMRKMSRRLREADRLLQLSPTQSGAIPEMPPSKAPAPGTAPQRLVHSRSGMEFRLATEPETAIGRRDPVTGIQPEIDLSPVDLQRSVSRRHAKIYRQDGRFFLIEEIGTVNGTFVNGQRVETGVPVEIKPGEEVRFGLVDLFFETK
jgi:CRP-like cAMP-binding protein